MAADKIKKELRCYLTETETVTYAKQAAVLVERIEDQENEKKMTAKQYAAEISALQDELFGLSRKVRNGFEVRPVDCEEIMDFEKKEVLIVRLDTYEPIESRKMTAKELQKPLFDDGAKKEVVEQFPDKEQMPDGSGFTVRQPADGSGFLDEFEARDGGDGGDDETI